MKRKQNLQHPSSMKPFELSNVLLVNRFVLCNRYLYLSPATFDPCLLIAFTFPLHSPSSLYIIIQHARLSGFNMTPLLPAHSFRIALRFIILLHSTDTPKFSCTLNPYSLLRICYTKVWIFTIIIR